MRSPGLIFAMRPVTSSSVLYVALSVNVRTTTTLPARASHCVVISSSCARLRLTVDEAILSTRTSRTSVSVASMVAVALAMVCWLLIGLFSASPVAVLSHLPHAQAQRVQLDEALGVALIVNRVALESGERLRVQRQRRAPARHHAVALVELQPRRAGDVLLRLVNQSANDFKLRRIPEAIIDHLGDARVERIFDVRDFTIQRQRLDGAMRGLQNRHARRLVDATRFHADE